MKPIDYPNALDLTVRLINIKSELGQLGLFKTMHALDTATKAIGYEIEEHLLHHAREAKIAASRPQDTPHD